MSSKDKPVVIGESMVQRLMELAGNRALYKKSLLKEEKEPKKEESTDEPDVAPETDSAPVAEEPAEEALEAEPMVDDASPIGDDIIDTDIDDDGDGGDQPINMDQFVDELAELMMRATDRQVTVGPPGSGAGAAGGDLDDEGLEDVGMDEEPLAEPPVEDVTAPDTSALPAPGPVAPTTGPLDKEKLESKRVSTIAQKIYEQLMAKIVKKSGVDLNEAKKNNQEVKVKLEPKTASQKKSLNEAKDGQPHQKAPFLTSKTTPAPAKGRGPDKPGKSPSPHPQPVKSSPKSNQNANSDIGKKK